MIKDSYRNKKVFITGHTGFKGSWLTLMLRKLGAQVLGYSLEPSGENTLFNICNIGDEVDSVFGDIRELNKLTEVMMDFKPDIIFHLAAQPLVRYSYKSPIETYETNVIGTLNVYEAARRCKSVKAIVSITTDKCYENTETIYSFRESDPMGGYDPYSSSKACAEILSSSYRRSFFEKEGILLATVRAGNVIGGGDFAEDRIIPDFVRAVTSNNSLEVRNPLSIRPWQHVLEPLSAYVLLGEKLLQGKEEFAEAWNFGPNDVKEFNVEQVLDECIQNWGKGEYHLSEDANPHEAMSLKLDISKARMYLKWCPVYKVEEAIGKTIEWYKNYYEEKIDMKEYSLRQINEYLMKIDF